MPPRPLNVVLITLDELNVSAMHLYGCPADTTPRLDRLATDGVVFDRAFCTFPKCTPSRAALLSGRYPHTDGHRTLPGFELGPDEDSLPRRLRAAGRRTSMIGKNHSVSPSAIGAHFDERPPQRGSGSIARRTEETDDTMFRAFYRGPLDPRECSDTVATEDALDFVTRAAGEPFFLLLNYEGPHPPYRDMAGFVDRIALDDVVVPDVEELADAEPVIRVHREVYDLESLEASQWRMIIRAYWSQMAYLDHEIGRVIDRLDELGLTEDTLIIVTADHGDFAGEHGCVEKWDTVFFDSLVQVPLIMSGPGCGVPGRRLDALTDNVDVTPTILQLCGLDVPTTMHGTSLAALLAGTTTQHKRHVFAEGGVEDDALTRMATLDDPTQQTRHPNYVWKQRVMLEHPWTMRRARMVRDEQWKLVYRLDGHKELYDLTADPGELHNVAAAPGASREIARLMDALLAWEIRTEPDQPPIHVMQA